MALLYFKYNIVDADKNNSKKNKSVFLKNNWNIFKYLKHLRHLMHRSSIASQIHLMKYSLILFVLGIWLDQKISNFLSEHFRWRYFHFPVYPNNGLKYLDLTVGLTIVAIAEEFVFRLILLPQIIIFLRSHLSSGKLSNLHSLIGGVISIIFFAGIHWGNGLKGVVNSIVWAIPITWYYLKYKDIRPCVIAHYMTDLFIFLKA